ncbi:glycosyltransferase family 87 protein [Sulfitobacter sp. F26204]|uniref:glycosyltransferase family 87 protein n=1 Tax=Sulfitobacter sp. F26204 TaxID=2996014 RepID=UPI00225E6809|nr:glycosyltransferase family 87 protein [Sulfitobacter sp. F26204]MCX7558737.1 glycosyltransferase family 87 protein [Sulfitobacter sp. F26204]
MILKPATVFGLLVCALLLIAYVALEFALPNVLDKTKLLDFDAFHLASVMMAEGNLAAAYDIATFTERQAVLAGFNGTQLLWSYPPTFDLVIAPLGYLPAWLAYPIFMAGTLFLFIWTLRRLDPRTFQITIILFLPLITLIIRGGQNSLLMATLIGCTCVLALRKSRYSGVPLGLMAIKPHLAIGFGIWSLINRRWLLAITSLATVAVFCALSFLFLGPQAWRAFFDGVSATGDAFQNNQFTIFRMSSIYAFGLSIGLDHKAALILHGGLVLGALAALLRLMQIGLLHRDMLGVGVFFSALVSPYNYDYDLAILTIAASLLYPTVAHHANNFQKALITLAAWIIGFYGIAVTVIIDLVSPNSNGNPPALIGPLLILIGVVVLHSLWRSSAASRPDTTGSTFALSQ